MSMREAMDRFLEDTFSQAGQAGPSPQGGDTTAKGPEAAGEAHGFSADFVERDGDFVMRAALPGVDPADLDVMIEGQSLVIRGERQGYEQRSGDRWLLREQSSGWFERSFHLPSAVDAAHAEAEFAHGVLTLTMPKASTFDRRQVRINTSPDQRKASGPAMVNPTLADPTKPEEAARRKADGDSSTIDATDTPTGDVVSAESEASFPASDPPSWTPERA